MLLNVPVLQLLAVALRNSSGPGRLARLPGRAQFRGVTVTRLEPGIPLVPEAGRNTSGKRSTLPPSQP
jgi:hypothetical protein